MGRSFEDDPLTLALQPPADESDAARAAREAAEADARRVSDAIDEQIKSEKAQLKKKKQPVKVLLLGQSESGKSTTLKNFQLTYAQKAWAEDRASWKAVVQLNLVRNATTILAVLSAELSRAPGLRSPTTSPTAAAALLDEEEGLAPLALTEKHRLLNLRLAPLKGTQKDLEGRIGASSTEPDAAAYASAGAPYAGPGPALPAAHRAHGGSLGGDGADGALLARAYDAVLPAQADFFVRGSNGWKSALDKLHLSAGGAGASKRRAPPPASAPAPGAAGPDAPDSPVDEVAGVLVSCAEDLKTLWMDPVVREMLRRRRVRMEDAPGFFLNDIDRIASRAYEPNDDDVVRARLRTLGVQEHKFVFEQGRAAGHEWLLYDVGGHRSARTTWAPYFDDVDAIIFLAPISCFDEKLAEDERVNRLEDTYLLWKAISKNKLLARTQIVLFLNKIDLLEKKLAAGAKVAEHVPSYGDRPNDVASVVKYFQTHFKEIAKQYNPQPRQFYVHLTSVIDTKATAATLAVVEEGILRDHLRRADLL